MDAKISLVPYDLSWPLIYCTESDFLNSRLKSFNPSLEHIGSTSVPGLLAKPIIDILMGVAPYPPAKAIYNAIQSCGYDNLDEAGVPGRIHFRKSTPICCNIHVALKGGPIWKHNLLIRDFLRANPEMVQEYNAHKQQGIKSGSRPLLAYSREKAHFMQTLLSRAQHWSRARHDACNP